MAERPGLLFSMETQKTQTLGLVSKFMIPKIKNKTTMAAIWKEFNDEFGNPMDLVAEATRTLATFTFVKPKATDSAKFMELYDIYTQVKMDLTEVSNHEQVPTKGRNSKSPTRPKTEMTERCWMSS